MQSTRANSRMIHVIAGRSGQIMNNIVPSQMQSGIDTPAKLPHLITTPEI